MKHVLRVSRWCLLASALLAFPACGARQPARQQAEVRFLIEPTEARVYVEDRFVGAAVVLRRRAERFPAGMRHFTVTAPGHFPHDVEVDLPPGTTTIRLRLRPIPP